MSEQDTAIGILVGLMFSAMVGTLLVCLYMVWKESRDYPEKAKKAEMIAFWALHKAREINQEIVRLERSKLGLAAQKLKGNQKMYLHLARIYNKEMHDYLEKYRLKRAHKAT